MSVYNCESCSFYTDRHNKLLQHFTTQKHMENSRQDMGSPPSSTQKGQSSVKHRMFKDSTNSETKEVTVNVTPLVLPTAEHFVEKSTSTSTSTSASASTVFTLLEICDNQIVSSRRIDANNSDIKFI